MRVHLGDDNNAAQFSRTLLDIGNGNILNNDGEVLIEPTIATSVTGQDKLIANVYPQVTQISEKTDDWLRERAILAPKNDSVTSINNKILSMFKAHQQTYLSIDNLTDQDNSIDIQIEFLNSLNPSGLPPHKLDLKIGAPIILMRNLNTPKLCNGTRLRMVTMQRDVIEATILSGSAQGQVVFIPRIQMITNE
ncbi:uncharacterized protein LOC111026624 [Myzus persicae]|uniref:uncharacterized protein LOC111026624 n=1 Tax=Myzus persicae TaxID=13164 RepID=UPI000B9371AD|nr:uncharacterized protein LOC111026624 [Myzus persicae]